jgi:putative ABC transport system substrate-binding protein
MKRREFLTLLSAGAAWPTMARAQRAVRIARVGYLGAAEHGRHPVTQAFVNKLRELGWEEGRNLDLTERAQGSDSRNVASAAADFLRNKVDVIVVVSTNAARVVQSVTRTIPIVVVSGSDPIAAGVAETLARPGGMVTGLTIMSSEMMTKRAEQIAQILPHASRIAILFNPTRSALRLLEEAIVPAVTALRLTPRPFPVGTPDEIEPAFDAIVQWPADGVVVLEDPMLYVQAKKVVGAALARKLPLACPFREMAQAGCLFSYSASLRERFERGAVYVDKILRGASPAELPFEQPAKFELVLNLITAKTLGLEFPDILSATADEVIE